MFAIGNARLLSESPLSGEVFVQGGRLLDATFAKDLARDATPAFNIVHPADAGRVQASIAESASATRCARRLGRWTCSWGQSIL